MMALVYGISFLVLCTVPALGGYVVGFVQGRESANVRAKAHTFR